LFRTFIAKNKVRYGLFPLRLRVALRGER